MNARKYAVQDGLIWGAAGNVLPCSAADRLALANGYYCAEQITKRYDEQYIDVDPETLKINFSTTIEKDTDHA